MKILYVLKRFPRLSETFVLHEMLRLEAAGVEVGVSSLKAVAETIRHPEVVRLRADVDYLDRGSIERQAQQVADRVRQGGFEHIHAHFATSASEVAIAAGAMAGVPVTVTCHAKDIFHADYASGLGDRLTGVSAVVTVSEYNRSHLERVLPGVPVHVVYNGVAKPSRVEPVDGGSVLSVARLVPKKGLDVLIEAMALLSGRADLPTLEMVGGGPLREHLIGLAARLGVDARFHGPLAAPEVDAAYRRASMFVLPCRIDDSGDRDGMPTVLGEAMRRGLPVVSSDLIGIPELVRHGETGLLAEPESPGSLAASIAHLLDDPMFAAELATKGAEHASSLLDPAAATEALLRVFGDATC